ncbi:MAG: hypothetical protein ABIQ70_04510 [Dokdonella sp.]
MTYKHLAHAGISTVALLFSTTLFASGFCDEESANALLGGHCSQTRATEEDSEANVSADYSDLDLNSMLGNSSPIIEFELNATNMFPTAPLTEAERLSDMAVFELQLTTGRTTGTPYNGRQALILTVSRLDPDQWILTFDWLAVASDWSIVTHAAPLPADTWQVEVPVALQPKVFRVTLVPSLDWHSVKASVSVRDRDLGTEIWSEPNDKEFSLGQQAKIAKPWRIRSGVLAARVPLGKLVSKLNYLKPDIEPPYR